MRLFATLFAFFLLLTSTICPAAKPAVRAPIPPVFLPQALDFQHSVGQLHYRIVSSFLGMSIEQEVLSATAWAVSDHILVTAGHVCAAVEEIANENRAPNVLSMSYIDENDEQKEFKGIRIMIQDPIPDLCVLYAKNQPLKILTVETNWKDNVHRMTHVNMVGAPMGVFPAWKECAVISKTGKELQDDYLKDRLITSCESLPGFSGSPLISDTGKVVGVISGGLLKAEKLPDSFASFGATAPQILEFLDGLR